MDPLLPHRRRVPGDTGASSAVPGDTPPPPPRRATPPRASGEQRRAHAHAHVLAHAHAHSSTHAHMHMLTCTRSRAHTHTCPMSVALLTRMHKGQRHRWTLGDGPDPTLRVTLEGRGQTPQAPAALPGASVGRAWALLRIRCPQRQLMVRCRRGRRAEPEVVNY